MMIKAATKAIRSFGERVILTIVLLAESHFVARRSSNFARPSQTMLAAGINIVATNIEVIMAAVIAIAKSENSWPLWSRKNRIGKKIATVVAVEASKAGLTSCVPFKAASKPE